MFSKLNSKEDILAASDDALKIILYALFKDIVQDWDYTHKSYGGRPFLCTIGTYMFFLDNRITDATINNVRRIDNKIMAMTVEYVNELNRRGFIKFLDDDLRDYCLM